MFQNKIKIFSLALLFTLIFFNGIFLGKNFFIDEDAFIMMKYSSNSVFNGGWNADALFGISTLYGDPGVNHYYSLFSTIEKLFNNFNFYNSEIFYNCSLIIIYSFSVTAIFYFLKYFAPNSNNIIAFLLSLLFLFGSSRYDLQFQRHWLIIGFGFPLYIIFLNEYFQNNKKIYLYKTSIVFFIVLYFGSIPALQNILISGFLFLLLKFFTSKKFYLKQFLEINFFSLIIIFIIGSWIWYPFISEIIQTKYIRAESYSDFTLINADYLYFFSEVFAWLFGPVVPSSLTLPTGSIKIVAGYTNMNFIFNFIFLIFMALTKNEKFKEIYYFFILYMIFLIILNLFPFIQGSLMFLLDTFSLEKINQEILILQICITNIVLNSDITKNLNIILKKFFVKFYLFILLTLTIIPLTINILKSLGLSLSNVVNNLLIIFEPNFYNLPSDIVRKILNEIFKRYEMSLNFNSLAYFSLTLILIFAIINFKKSIFIKNKILLCSIILVTNYFLASYFYPLSSSERFWSESKKNDYLPTSRFYNIKIDKKKEFLNGDYNLLDDWINNKPLIKKYYGHRETPGMNFSGLTSFYPKDEGEMIIKNSNISKLRVFVIGDLNFLDSKLFKNSSINYIISDKKFNKSIPGLFLYEKYKSKFIYKYELSLPFYYLVSNLKYDDYNNYEEIEKGTIFLKNITNSFDENDFRNNENKIQLLEINKNELVFSFSSKKKEILFLNNSFNSKWSLTSNEYSQKSFECNFFKNCFLLEPGEYKFKIFFKNNFNYGIYISILSLLVFFSLYLKLRSDPYRN